VRKDSTGAFSTTISPPKSCAGEAGVGARGGGEVSARGARRAPRLAPALAHLLLVQDALRLRRRRCGRAAAVVVVAVAHFSRSSRGARRAPAAARRNAQERASLPSFPVFS